jgi:hypothetical protein
MSKTESNSNQKNLLAEREADQNHSVEMVDLAEATVFQEIAIDATPTEETGVKKASVEILVKLLDLVVSTLRQEKLIVNKTPVFSSPN